MQRKTTTKASAEKSNGLVYSLEKLRHKMYLLRFPDNYLLTMTFLRVSEFCESSKWAGHNITLAQFMAWYSKNHSTSVYPDEGAVRLFTYPTDWSGYNIKSEYLDKLYPDDRSASPIKDWNEHDDLIDGIARTIRFLEMGDDFYLLGCQTGEDGNYVLQHEMAHGFFYLDEGYAEAQTDVIRSLDPEFRDDLFNILRDMTYSEDVLVDEAHAYLSTGPADEMAELTEMEEWIEAEDQCKHIFDTRMTQPD